MVKARKVPCPRCGTLSDYSAENNWRPFCTERCRMIDLGKWASDEYRLPDAKKEEKSGSEPGSEPDSS